MEFASEIDLNHFSVYIALRKCVCVVRSPAVRRRLSDDDENKKDNAPSEKKTRETLKMRA